MGEKRISIASAVDMTMICCDEVTSYCTDLKRKDLGRVGFNIVLAWLYNVAIACPGKQGRIRA